ncbi:MAG: hypothetical protein HGA54_02085 [Actinobacteria bacterium]|nr:hypothetical protein [Actinomycetota bacterium]
MTRSAGRHSKTNTSANGKEAPKPMTDAASAGGRFGASSGSNLRSSMPDRTSAQERPFARTSQRKTSSSKRKHFVSSRIKHIRLIVAVVIAVAVVVVVGGLYATNMFATKTVHDEATDRLITGIELVQNVDVTIVALDTAIAEQVSADSLDDLQVLLDGVPEASGTLDEALVIFTGLGTSLNGSEESDVLEQAAACAEARKLMLEYGSQLITYDIGAMKSATAFSEAWVLIIDADTKSRQATTLVAAASTQNVTISRDTNTAAIASLDSALAKIDTASQAFPEVDFTPLIAYVNAKREAITYALASDEAFLADDTATSDAKTAEYNTANAKAIELAAALPADPTQMILQTYETVTSPIRASYLAAREQASAADVHVREYLGINQTVDDKTSTAASTSTPATSDASTESAENVVKAA